MPRIRTFLAVEIDDGIRRSAAALQAALAQSGAAVKWVDPASMHVTLQFLGEVDDRDLPALCRAVAKVTKGLPPFALRAAGVGAFPTPRRPKVVWAGITDGATELQHLFAALEPPLIDLGLYRREERGYTPHLTLGRTKSEADGAALAAVLPKHLAWQGGHTAVEEVVIFSSELRRDGPEYTPLGRAALQGLRPAGDVTE
ncbi:MAG: RNA 2',3'-cyclic phosphodiesterase [Gemmataceae bacterium]